MLEVNTDYGKISITKNVVGCIITKAIDDFDGKVIISNHRGKVPGLVSKIGGLDDMNNMEITIDNNHLDIRIFIVIRFGTSITMVTNQLIDNLNRNIVRMTGREPNSIAVVVTGTISKNIARRHIEVTTNEFDG